MTITIYLRDLDKDNKNAYFKVEPLTMRKAKKIFNKLVQQWNSKRKGIVIPGYGVAIASDRIYNIIFDKDE